jgi:hypothetical protein
MRSAHSQICPRKGRRREASRSLQRNGATPMGHPEAGLPGGVCGLYGCRAPAVLQQVVRET